MTNQESDLFYVEVEVQVIESNSESLKVECFDDEEDIPRWVDIPWTDIVSGDSYDYPIGWTGLLPVYYSFVLDEDLPF